MKTNDVTGRFQEGEVGCAPSWGGPVQVHVSQSWKK
jgi:hypothetical protein